MKRNIATNEAKPVTAEQATRIVKSGGLLFDTRRAGPFREKTIPGARHICVDTVTKLLQGIDHNTPLVFFGNPFDRNEYTELNPVTRLALIMGFRRVYQLTRVHNLNKKPSHKHKPSRKKRTP